MSRWLAVILLTGCASSGPVICGPLERYSGVKLQAHEYWKDAGVETTTAYVLEYLTPEALEIECGLSHIDGCSHLESSEIYIKSGISPERQLVVLMHEVGHITKGKIGHLKCLDNPGDDIMCEAASKNGSRPTKRDVKFITE